MKHHLLFLLLGLLLCLKLGIAFPLRSPLRLVTNPSRTTSIQNAYRSFDQETIEEVRKSVPIVDVVRQHVDLQEIKDGEWQGCCPFHDDKSPSMGVNEEKGVYHCFACHASGDVFKFVAEIEGLSFSESVEALAEQCGIALPEESLASAAVSKEHSRIHMALEAAAEYYGKMLLQGSGGGARSHLRERQIGPALAAEFQLGFSHIQPGALFQHLMELNVTTDELVGSGLFSPQSLEQYGSMAVDRMCGRLVIPIRNTKGQMVAFSGRLIVEKSSAKYVNTPETPIFKKRSILYGLHLARRSIRESGTAILVEGYFDVMALHSAGLKHVVACMGSAITQEHIRALRNALPTDGEIILVLDGDKAGIEAVQRACKTVLIDVESEEKTTSFLNVKVAELPSPFKDPADFVLAKGQDAGSEFEKEVLRSALSWKEWYALRLIDVGEEHDDTSAFSRRNEALTDFLSRLPPTRQADRTYLSSVLANHTFPDNEALSRRLTSDLIQQADEKSRIRLERLASRTIGNGNKEQRVSSPNNNVRKEEARSISPPQATVSLQEEMTSSLVPSPRMAPAPVPPSRDAANVGHVVQEMTRTTIARAQQGFDASPRYSPPLPPPNQRIKEESRRRLETIFDVPKSWSSPLPSAAAAPAAPPSTSIEEGPSRERSSSSSPLFKRMDIINRSKELRDLEERLFELVIFNPRARQCLFDFVGDQDLVLSNKAHQALLDWLLGLRHQKDDVAFTNANALSRRFEAQRPEYRGLLTYFDPLLSSPPSALTSSSPSRSRVVRDERYVLASMKKVLHTLVEASVARRAQGEMDQWTKKLGTLALRRKAISPQLHTSPVPSRKKTYQKVQHDQHLQTRKGGTGAWPSDSKTFNEGQEKEKWHRNKRI